MTRLQGKVAVITGATSGIGKRTAEVFVEHGATVVISGRRAPEGERLAKELGERASFVRADVTLEADIKKLIDHAVSRFGTVDCLFNNAGQTVPGRSIEEVTAEQCDQTMAMFFRSVVLGMKYVAPVMRQRRSGSIINTGSIGALRAGYSSLLYSGAKAAVAQITRYVATELGPHGVRVNCISPGAIVTGIFGKAAGLPDADENAPKLLNDFFAGVQPIPRAGLPDDVARAALWLASEESRFVTGHDLVVDGGLTAGLLWSQQQDLMKQMRSALLPNP